MSYQDRCRGFIFVDVDHADDLLLQASREHEDFLRHRRFSEARNGRDLLTRRSCNYGSKISEGVAKQSQYMVRTSVDGKTPTII
jgi:hypothetical protein